ncbi:MAG: hypothetical protein HZB53_04345 [Chloroflexi bacterium]|nr:hypothetical protein [Chloroflexota bacterium]
MSYSQITWYIVTAFALSTGAVALGSGASLTTAIARGVIAMMLLGTLGWVANVVLLLPEPARSSDPDKGVKLDAMIDDEPAAAPKDKTRKA